MSDTTTDDAPTEEPPEGKEDQAFDEQRAKEKINKANQEAANLRKRLKEAEAKAKKYDEHEEATKSEQQKAADAIAQATKKAEAAEARALRLEVAAEHGLSPAQAKRLVGDTREELEADAEELLGSFKPNESEEEDPLIPRTLPGERLRGDGNKPDPTATNDEAFGQQLLGRLKR